MKKSICMLLASVLLMFALTACQGSEKSSTFETLNVTLDGEKTLSMEMNQKEVRTAMGEEPTETETQEEAKRISDEWESFSLSVEYFVESPYEVAELEVSLPANTQFETSFGIAKGDSAASVKEKLGELCMTKEIDSGVSYTYGLLYADGKYQIVDYNKSFDELVGDNKDAKVYLVNFSCVDDKVAAFYIVDAFGDFQRAQ